MEIQEDRGIESHRQTETLTWDMSQRVYWYKFRDESMLTVIIGQAYIPKVAKFY